MTEVTTLDRPIILLGFHRSGTTMLGRIFSQHPDIGYLSEPRHVWMHSFPYRRYDTLRAADARPAVTERVRREFADFLVQEGKTRFAEKTPSNMVRLPFIKETMPDCRVIHIIRDGRACTYSTLQVLKRPPSGKLIKKRARAVPWWHYPSYILKAWRNVVVPRLTGKTVPYWGPRIPGLRRKVRQLPQDEMCAWQWQESMRIARRDAAGFPPSQYREWHYEDVVANPGTVVREMFEFAGLSFPDELAAWLADNIHGESLAKWKANLSEDAVQRITPQLEPLLSDLGYS